MTEPAPAKTALVAGGQIAALVPQSLDEAFRLSQALAMSGLAPRGMEKPEQIMVAIIAGAELGLPPFQSLQSFAVINGRPTLWGDGLMAVARSQGVQCREWVEGAGDACVAFCEVTRPDTGEQITRSFSVEDAKKASLWGKTGPWQSYPKRMLAMRARAWALRDGCADMLRGFQVREEVEDYQPIRDVTPPAKADLRSRLTNGGEGFDREHVAEQTAEPKRGRRKSPEAAADAAAQVEELQQTQSGGVLEGDDIPAEGGARPTETAGAQPAETTAGTSGSATDASTGSLDLGGSSRDSFGEQVREVVAEEAAEPEQAAEEHPPIDEEGEDDLPAEFKAYVEQVETAKSWQEVKKAMAVFYKTPLFTAMRPAQQNKIRATTWDIMAENKLSDLPDQAMDISAFRLWIEWCDDKDAITGTMDVWKRDAAYRDDRPPEFKRQIEGAVADRLAELDAEAGA